MKPQLPLLLCQLRVLGERDVQPGVGVEAEELARLSALTGQVQGSCLEPNLPPRSSSPATNLLASRQAPQPHLSQVTSPLLVLGKRISRGTVRHLAHQEGVEEVRERGLEVQAHCDGPMREYRRLAKVVRQVSASAFEQW